MSTVLRIAFTCFTIVPLQRWVAGFGVGFIVIALAMLTLGRSPMTAISSMPFCILGASLIGMIPAMLGGAAQRSASSRTMLHLRPHGRLRMLLGATLVVTLLAALGSLHILLRHLAYVRFGLAEPTSHMTPGEMFTVCWTLLAFVWIAAFAISSSPMLMPFAILALLPLTGLLKRESFVALANAPVPGPLLFVAGATAWTAFAVWYLTAPSFRQPVWFGNRAAQNLENSPLGALLALLETRDSAVSPQRAIHYMLLGFGSPVRYAFSMCAWLALILLVMKVFLPKPLPLSPVDMSPFFLLSFASFTVALMANQAAARSRLLWLRTGTDRASLFSLAERNLLQTGGLMLAVLGTGAIALTALRTPTTTSTTMVFAAAQIPLWTFMLYGGMFLTRAWIGSQIMLSFGLFIPFLIHAISFRPSADPSPGYMLGASAVYLALAAILRIYARHRWINLDWRVARMPLLRKAGI
jgi:hypothetical protein